MEIFVSLDTNHNITSSIVGAASVWRKTRMESYGGQDQGGLGHHAKWLEVNPVRDGEIRRVLKQENDI